MNSSYYYYYFPTADDAADVRRERHQQRQRSCFTTVIFFALLALLILPAAVVASASNGRSYSATKTSIPFQYSDQDVEECVSEMSTEEEEKQDADNNENGEDSSSSSNNATTRTSCTKLYDEFKLHYHGIGPVIVDGSSPSPSGFIHFKETVRYVYEQNNSYDPNAASHKLRLNQFADKSQQSNYYSKKRNDEEEDGHSQKPNNWQVELEKFWNEHKSGDNNDDTDESNTNQRNNRLLRWEGTDVRLLDTPLSIDKIEEQRQEQHQEQQLRRSLRWNKKKASASLASASTASSTTNTDIDYIEPALLSSVLRTRTTSNGQHTKVMMPGDGSTVPAAFSSPQVPTFIHGTEVELHKGSSKDSISNNDVADEDIFDKKNKKHHEFSNKLNWSTKHNPDGVPLVHNVFDQGTCGSCWAFAATGSVEASAARNTARNHFVNGLQEISEKLIEQKNNDDVNNNNDDDDDDDDDDDVNGRHGTAAGYYTMIEELTEESREVEKNAFQELNLSIQELLECDTKTNEGCIGGNPLLAFYYIHKHGLVPWTEYPYIGYGYNEYEYNTRQERTTIGTTTSNTSTSIYTETVEEQEEQQQQQQKQVSTSTTTSSSLLLPSKLGPLQPPPQTQQEQQQEQNAPVCKKKQIQNPIATVESWGLLHKNHENLIEYALLYVGPVAVGFNGADPSFINYGSGIFDSVDCDQTANHALLIVGYDQVDVVTTNEEEDGTKINTTETIRYWIARNSWGESWGENGFVKIKRGTGGKGVPGVCGIARSPSVALGGVYRSNRMEPFIVRDGKDGDNASSSSSARFRKGKYGDWNDSSPASLRIGMSTNHPICNSMFTGRGSTHLNNGCFKFANAYENNQAVFFAFICMAGALIVIIPLTISIFRQHRTARGAGSIRLEYYGDEDPATSLHLSEQSLHGMGTGGGAAHGSSSSLSYPTERTHLLTLKDMYAPQRKETEFKQKPRGRSIIMTSPEQDPFQIVPSSTIDTDHNKQ